MALGDRVRITLDSKSLLNHSFETLSTGLQGTIVEGTIVYINGEKTRCSVELEFPCCNTGIISKAKLASGTINPCRQDNGYGKGKDFHCVYVHTKALEYLFEIKEKPKQKTSSETAKMEGEQYLTQWLNSPPGLYIVGGSPHVAKSDHLVADMMTAYAAQMSKYSDSLKQPSIRHTAGIDPIRNANKLRYFAERYGMGEAKLDESLKKQAYFDEVRKWNINEDLKPVKVDKIQDLVRDDEYQIGITKFSKSRMARLERIGKIHRGAIEVMVDIENYNNPYGISIDYNQLESKTLHSILGLKPEKDLAPINMPLICQL